ncbi:MAG: hypothetical protein PHN31_00725 [Candidatus Gracilibacteria bacterium]|nr:hypothetical protein [Candidatus Gracilibacteria bacterium]
MSAEQNNEFTIFNQEDTQKELKNLFNQMKKLDKDTISIEDYNNLKNDLDNYGDYLGRLEVPNSMIKEYEIIIDEYNKIVDTFESLKTLELRKEEIRKQISSSLLDMLEKCDKATDGLLLYDITDSKIIIKDKLNELVRYLNNSKSEDELKEVELRKNLFISSFNNYFKDVSNNEKSIQYLADFVSQFRNDNLSMGEEDKLNIIRQFNIKGDDFTDEERKVNTVFIKFSNYIDKLKETIPYKENEVHKNVYLKYIQQESLYQLKKLSGSGRIKISDIDNLKLKNFTEWKNINNI